MNKRYLILAVILFSIVSCEKDPQILDSIRVTGDDLDTTTVFKPTPYNLIIPSHFTSKSIIIPDNNPMTEEGVSLGRKLFYDPILSLDSTISCSSCHQQSVSFSDAEIFSKGVGGAIGKRQSMHVVNALWSEPFFWDGRTTSLEEQAFRPVPSKEEMNLNWDEAVARLNSHNEYPELFKKAFGVSTIDSNHVVMAIAQFERTLISASSKYDEFLLSDEQPINFFSSDEFAGYQIFNTEIGDCFHCHGEPLLLTDNEMRNNGLDDTFDDVGFEKVTGDPNDRGKFKVPSLRNVEYTAPYMHDGRFQTLEEVVEFYSFGVKQSPTIDPLMKKAHQGGIQLTLEERQQLVAFLKTFSDSSFLTNPAFSNPF